MHTLALIAASPFAGLFATVRGLISQAVAGLLSVVVGIAILAVIWKLIKAMLEKPSVEKLLGIVGVGILAVVLAGAAPGLLSASYQWGKELGTGGAASLTIDSGQ